jgi:hypothetical protein
LPGNVGVRGRLPESGRFYSLSIRKSENEIEQAILMNRLYGYGRCSFGRQPPSVIQATKERFNARVSLTIGGSSLGDLYLEGHRVVVPGLIDDELEAVRRHYVNMIRKRRPGLQPNCCGLMKCSTKMPPFASMTRCDAMLSGSVVIST